MKKCKKVRFLPLVNKYDPDVICDSKSHLDQPFYASEVFPDTYRCLGKTVP